MADNYSQPRTSTDSGSIINNISGSNIDKVIQTINNTASTSISSTKVDIDYCPAPASTFLGRYEELGTLKTLLTQHQMVALVGMGGLGKTQLSRKYVQVNKADYKYKYWLESESPEKLKNSFKELAKILHIESDNINKVVNDVYKKIGAVPTILVFDNVEQPADVYAYLPTRLDLPTGVTIHVLVTSRWAEWTCDEQIQCYKLQPLDISTSLQIFHSKFGQPCIETIQDKWEALAEMLGYLPLALQVATSYIYKRTKHNSDLLMILADYMQQLEEGAAGLLNDPLTEYDNRSVYVSMMLTLKQLENKVDNVSNVQDGVQWKLAVNLINAAAYMNPDEIKKKCLLKLADNHKDMRILDEALIILTEYSLFNQGVNWSGEFYSVHRIIQTSIRHNQSVKGTADMYYIGVLKHALAYNGCNHGFEFKYANERVPVVVDHYRENSSSKLLRFLVEYNAITAMQGIFNLMSNNKNKIQSQIQQEHLLDLAVKNQNLSMVQLLCRNGANINQMSWEWDGPPLHCALRVGNMEIAKWLLQNGAAPTVRDKNGRTALHVAARQLNKEMISFIIEKDRAIVHATDNDGNTPLHTIEYYNAKEKNVLAIMLVLIENGVDITKRNKSGDTILHSAARGACDVAVTLFLQLNKNFINSVNKCGETALHVIPYDTDLVEKCILSTIDVLLDNGVDFSKVDSRGNTVLHYAAQGACAAAVTLFLQLNKNFINSVNENGETALHVIRYDNAYIDEERILSTIRVLLDNGVDFSKVDSRGNTVLHYVARSACAEAVSLILQLNKDFINIVNGDGATALHVIPYEHTDIGDERILSTIRVLLETGMDFSKVDSRGNTVLHSAARGARVAAVSLFLQLNKDLINSVNENGETALHVIRYGNTFIDEERILSTIRVLLDNGMDFSKVDSRGNTVLHYAAQGARVAAVALILQRNKDLINSVNGDGATALHVIPYDDTYIDDERILSTIRVLLDNGVDFSKVDSRGNTVLHYVAGGARAEAVALILQRNKDLINSVNEDGETALHVIPYDDTYIDEERILSTIRVLLDNGVDFSKVDSRGNTVLHYVARGACAEAVTFFLQLNKEFIDIKNVDGATAFHVLGNYFDSIFAYLSEKERMKLFARIKETARVLIMNGLLLNTRDKEQRTPLDTVLPAFKDILLQVAEECNNQLMESPEKRQRTE